MKKLFLPAFLFFLLTAPVFAIYVSGLNNSINVYQSLNQSAFGMEGKWFWADSVVLPVAGIVSSGGEYEVEPFFFQEFDYPAGTKIDILESVHPVDTYSIPAEGDAVFKVQYADIYGNDPSQDYPKLILTYPDSSMQTYIMKSGADNVFSHTLNLPKGEYKYEYIATNEHYVYGDGFYRISGNWYVTSRPYNFSYTYPKTDAESVPDDTDFRWKVYSDESSDTLAYEIYYWLDGDKGNMKKMTGFATVNGETSRKVSGLEHMRKYHWYMRIANKYGADLITEEYSFYTGGTVQKFYNAPNPFNPAIGQKTKFVFNMPQSGIAKLVIYSEYGDKVWESETANYAGDSSQSKEITYDGRDNSGRTLYNGTYLAVLTKKYGGTTKVEKCRILVIK